MDRLNIHCLCFNIDLHSNKVSGVIRMSFLGLFTRFLIVMSNIWIYVMSRVGPPAVRPV